MKSESPAVLSSGFPKSNLHINGTLEFILKIKSEFYVKEIFNRSFSIFLQIESYSQNSSCHFKLPKHERVEGCPGRAAGWLRVWQDDVCGLRGSSGCDV